EDRTKTREELEKITGETDTAKPYGLAIYKLDSDAQYKWKREGCCCCVWIESLTFTLIVQKYVAKDTPPSELDRTHWHEDMHIGHYKQAFEDSQWREGVEDFLKKYGKGNAYCEPLGDCTDDGCQKSFETLRDSLFATLISWI